MAESGRETEGEEEDSGASDEYEYVTLTSAEVLEKLEEVCVCVCEREREIELMSPSLCARCV